MKTSHLISQNSKTNCINYNDLSLEKLEEYMYIERIINNN